MYHYFCNQFVHCRKNYGIILKFPVICWVDLDVFLCRTKSSSWTVINCFQGIFANGSNGPGGEKVGQISPFYLKEEVLR